MDKTRKLRRYTRKDYTQVVDFPVEIVGRDGVVRRYSFEESIRLYQRRIASAAARYDDGEVAVAEAEHCRRRIAQLRRSYLERYGNESLRLVEDLGKPGLAGEVAAFLRRCLSATEGLEEIHLESLGPLEHCSAWSVRSVGGGPALLLYLFAFEGPNTGPSRDAFFAHVKVLQNVQRSADGVETLIGFHHSADFGLVLTGTGEVARSLSADGPADALPVAWETAEEPIGAGAHREAMLRLRRGDPEGALQAFVKAYEDDHFRRSAYLGATVVADRLGRFEEAAMAAEMGTRYFPDDPGLAYHLAVVRLRRGETVAARAAVVRAQAFEAHPHAVSFLRALIALREGRLASGRRLLQETAQLDEGPDADLAKARRRVRGSLGLLALSRMAALGLALGGAWLAMLHPRVGLSLLAAGVAVFAAAPIGWRLWFRHLLSRPGRGGLALASAATMATAGQRVERSQ